MLETYNEMIHTQIMFIVKDNIWPRYKLENKFVLTEQIDANFFLKKNLS
jgi:hypothetical protein